MLIFDNSDSTICQRLLELYPLDVLRKEYGLKGDTKEVTSKIVATHTVEDIKEDCVRLMPHCKQHIYFFTHNLKAGQLPKRFFQFKVPHFNAVEETAGKVDHEYLLAFKNEYWEVNGQTALPKTMIYWWPIRVILTPDVLQIRITVIERNTRLKQQGLFFKERTLEDEGVVRMVKAALGIASNLAALDLNKGIKALCESDHIDMSFAAHTTAKSFDTSAMRTGFTIKKHALERYEEIMKAPLRKGVFASSDGSTLPELFSSDPSEGMLGFRRYNGDIDAIGKLVDLLLTLNK